MGRPKPKPMNPVEWLLYAASIALIAPDPPICSMDASREQLAALWVADQGAQRRGFRYVPGILFDDIYPWFMAGLASCREPYPAGEGPGSPKYGLGIPQHKPRSER